MAWKVKYEDIKIMKDGRSKVINCTMAASLHSGFLAMRASLHDMDIAH